MKAHASRPIQDWVFKHRDQLNMFIDSVWKWESVEQSLDETREPRVETLQRAAAAPCVCDGAWRAAVLGSWAANPGVDPNRLCAAILRSLKVGRHPSVTVPMLGGAVGGEGKSLFLKGLGAVYGPGNVMNVPEKSNFPLLDLEKGPKVIFLDEWRFKNKTLSYGAQCLLLDGSAVPVARPQNRPGADGNWVYEGSAPVFITGKLAEVTQLASDADREGGGDASMLHRRLDIFPYTVRIPKPACTVTCARCFAQLVLERGQAAAAASSA